MTAPLLEARDLHAHTLEGRPLFRGLHLTLGAEQVAMVGRNGVGKSTLLRLLAGEVPAPRVTRRGALRYVPQVVDAQAARAQALAASRRDPVAWAREATALGLPHDVTSRGGPLSGGERRKLALLAAWLDAPDLLLLDEPTEDLDEVGVTWLLARVRAWRGGLVVVSHHPPLLRALHHFFVVQESGCRAFSGSFDALLARLQDEDDARQARYARHLGALDQAAAHDDAVRRRRQRKVAVGRVHELDRSQSRMRLNQRRAAAQVSDGRLTGVRDARLEARRAWAHASRRALAVRLPLELAVPAPGPAPDVDVLALEGVTVRAGGRALARDLDLRVRHDRVAVVGPNGAGKTTVLRTALGEVRPDLGVARARIDRVGVIAQGATDWCVEETLRARLARVTDAPLDRVADQLVAHRFPLALAERPLASLSPGERTRAALICLFAHRPVLDVLVLDEPTAGLDLLGLSALTDALRAWRGGLVVASHDRAFLDAVGVTRWVTLG